MFEGVRDYKKFGNHCSREKSNHSLKEIKSKTMWDAGLKGVFTKQMFFVFFLH